MVPYEYTEGQKRFFRRMHAANRELERCCDCNGCTYQVDDLTIVCTGFVRNCKCDEQQRMTPTERKDHQKLLRKD